MKTIPSKDVSTVQFNTPDFQSLTKGKQITSLNIERILFLLFYFHSTVGQMILKVESFELKTFVRDIPESYYQDNILKRKPWLQLLFKISYKDTECMP